MLTPNQFLCTEALAWLRAAPTGSVDAILTDPPYGLGQLYCRRREACTTAATYGPWIQEVFRECCRVVKPDGFVVIRQAYVYTRHLWEWFHYCELGALWRTFVPDRGYPVGHGWDPYIVWFDWRRHPRRGVLWVNEELPPAARTNLARGTILTNKALRETRRSVHPCPMPVDAAESLVQQFSAPGDLVLDPFMGIGTIPLAAWHQGRSYIGIDRERQFVNMAKVFLLQYTNIRARAEAKERQETEGRTYDTQTTADHQQNDRASDQVQPGARPPAGGPRPDPLPPGGPARLLQRRQPQRRHRAQQRSEVPTTSAVSTRTRIDLWFSRREISRLRRAVAQLAP